MADKISDLRTYQQQHPDPTPAQLEEYYVKYQAAVEARLDERTKGSKSSIIRGLNRPLAERDVDRQVSSNPGTEAVAATQEGQKAGGTIGAAVATAKIAVSSGGRTG